MKTKIINFNVDWDNRFMMKSKVGKYTISTVYLGINHQFNDNLPPLYYETMIFSDNGDNAYKNYQVRYTTMNEAINGHNIAVDFVKESEGIKWKK